MPEFIYDKIAIGNRIREHRDRLGLTQEELAERIERSWRLVADLERGAVGFSMETLFRLCNALQAAPNDLLLPEADGDLREVEWLTSALRNSPARVRDAAAEILRAYLRSV